MIIPFFRNRNYLHLILFFICVIFIIVIILFIIISFYSNEKEVNNVSHKALIYLLPIVSVSLYLPIQMIFLSTLTCENGMNFYMTNLTCWQGIHYFYVVIGIIMAIALYCISIFTVQTMIQFGLFNEDDPLIKYTTSHDVNAVRLKTYFVVVYSLLSNHNMTLLWQWGIASINLYIMIMVNIHIIKVKPYLNISIMKCEMLCYLIVLWSYCVLFLCIILQSTAFNGGVYLFFAGIPFLIVLCLLRDENDFYSKHLSSPTKDECTIMLRIFTLLKIIKRIKQDREAFLLIKGYIYVYEETCYVHKCPLKKLKEEVGEDIDMEVITFSERLNLFYQHLEIKFKNEIKKFPNYLGLRVFYAYFLLKIMKKKYQAIEQMDNIVNDSLIKKHLTLDKEFVIYKMKKFMENHEDILLNRNISNSEEIIDTLMFKKEMLNFKALLKEINLLYIEFWNILLLSASENSENLEYLNNIGKKINRRIDKISQSFRNIQQIKTNDIEILQWYSDFLLNVMNDKRKASFYRKLLNDIMSKENALISSSEIGEDDFQQVNIININSSDNNYYIIVSSLIESLGIITNLSLGTCSMFGYTKKDIIGKKIDILLPEIMVKQHSKLLFEKTNEIKKEIMSNNNEGTGTYEYKSKDILTFGITKSKYLIPISIKISIIYNDNNEFSYIAKIVHAQNASLSYKGFLYGSSLQSYSYLSDSSLNECYVITNNEFIIQNYTPNAVTMLGLDSHSINGITDITEYIKEFNEEVVKMYIVKDEKVPQQHQHKLRVHIKQQVQHEKFNNDPVIITWKKHELHEYMKMSSKNKLFRFPTRKCVPLSMTDVPGYENVRTLTAMNCGITRLCLTVKEERIGDIKIGYLFIMESFPENNIHRASTKKKEIRERFRSAKIVTQKAKFTNGSQKIDKNFIPEVYSKFKLDLKEMSYKCKIMNNTNNNNNNDKSNNEQSPRNESIKKYALNKLNLIVNKDKKKGKLQSMQTDDDDDNESDEYSENEDDEDDDDEYESNDYKHNSSSNSFTESCNDKSEQMTPIRTSLTNPHLNKLMSNIKNKSTPFTIQKEEDEVYYHVNLSKIKLMIYDFNKKTFIEKNEQLISQVEKQKMPRNYKSNSKLPQTKSNKTNPNLSSDELIKINKYTTHYSECHSDDYYYEDSFYEPITQLNQKNLLLKQIEKSLQKQETQPSIIALTKASSLTIISLLFIGIGLMIYCSHIFKHIKENFLVIEKSLDLVFNLILGQFYVKNLILINNENYTNYSGDPNDAFNESLTKINSIHKGNDEKLTYLLATYTPLRNESYTEIKSESIAIEYIKEDYTVGSYYVPIYSAYSQINSALQHITTLIKEEAIPTQLDLFFYMRNGMNSVFSGIQNHNEIFMQELIYNISVYKLYLFLIFGGCVLLFIIDFLYLIFSYDKVAERKESYLEVFFDINKHSIETSLESCEFFNKKIQADLNDEKEMEVNGNDDYSYKIITNNYGNVRNNNEVTDNANGSNNNKGVSSRNKLGHKKRDRVSTRDTKIVKMKIFLVLFVLFVYLLCIVIFLNIDLQRISKYVDLFQNFVQLHISNLYLFNFLREFAFDHTLPVFNMPGTYFDDELYKIYSQYGSNEGTVMENINHFPSEFIQLYNKIFERDICEYGIELFKGNSNTTCDTFFEGAARFGLQSLIISFVEEIRYLKNYYILFEVERVKFNYHYNLTLVGTARQSEKWPHGQNDTVIKKYIQLNPIRLFNLKEFTNLNKALIYFLEPCYMALVDKMTQCIFDKISYSIILYAALMACFLMLSVVWFFAYFVPFVNGLNQIIYKTKNMLNIIPKNVLLKIPNIDKVLDIVPTSVNKTVVNNDNIKKQKTQNYNYDIGNNYWM